jgi:hypothetical protein
MIVVDSITFAILDHSEGFMFDESIGSSKESVSISQSIV